MDLKEQIAVMEGFSNGKTIEVSPKGTTNWQDEPFPSWNFQDFDYRIKPIQVRHYSPKELIEAIKAHGPILKHKTEDYYYTITNFGPTTIGMIDNYYNYSINEIIKDYVWADDESPFGFVEVYN